MQNLYRRASGIYVLRLTVPVRLRPTFGKREIIVTTGTSVLCMAKIVAGALATQWRQRFFETELLVSQCTLNPMHHSELLKVTQGHPLLLAGGHITLTQAAGASGIASMDLLRACSNGKLRLYIRPGRKLGFLVPLDALPFDNPEVGSAGGYIVPDMNRMPSSAIEHINPGLLMILTMDVPDITSRFLSGQQSVTPLSFEDPGHSGLVFIPNENISVTLAGIEVLAGEVEMIRRSLSDLIPPERVAEAKATQQRETEALKVSAGKKSHERLSIALVAYITGRVRQDVSSESEITRIQNGCALLIELSGDAFLADIDGETLRGFRDKKLSRVPANENKIRLMHGTTTVSASIEKVADTDWPIMSPAERNKRMQWISAWFRWLHDQKWITNDLASELRGESVQSKAERNRDAKNAKRDDEDRAQLGQDELTAIFGAYWFKTGRGEMNKAGTTREFSPYYYWLPLLGLYTGGGRINELCQLHLTNVQQTPSGQWYIDFNEMQDDQKLKTVPSKRIVPVHPALLTLGFDKWVHALREANYVRLFPELKFDIEKGYGKPATKWFTGFMKRLGFERNGEKTFHSFRHTYINALPVETPDRIANQMTGHARGKTTRESRYKKDAEPEVAARFVNEIKFTLPTIAPFDIECGLRSVMDALQRKDAGHGAVEDIGKY